MSTWGLNTYFYGPKDDLKHRTVWREPYSPTEAQGLQDLITACSRRGIAFIYALGPGLDIRYGSDADLDHLRTRFQQMLGLGCRHFALLFDDIPDHLDPADLARWGSLAEAQSHVANRILAWLRLPHPQGGTNSPPAGQQPAEHAPPGRLLFCPTPYCGRMALRRHGGEGYLDALGAALDPAIDILWTGPEIISREISVEHIADITRVLRRKPVIWDNLHANDYDGRRFFCGPYSGRPLPLRQAVGGLLSNANCELPLNFIPFRTLAAFVHARDAWDPRSAYLGALHEWHPHFQTCGDPLSFEDLRLFTDCFYLPHELGGDAAALLGLAQDLLTRHASTWGANARGFRALSTRLRTTCARMAELRERPLFHALSRRVWELREELDLLERYVAFRAAHPDPSLPWGSDFHLPDTYRGGLVARLQHLLLQQPDGSFTHATLPHPPVIPTP